MNAKLIEKLFCAGVHEKCFIVFMIFSTLYMLLLCQLLRSHRNIPSTFLESKSLRVKWILVIINLSCFVLACYVFIRHNTYCEEGSMSAFIFKTYSEICVSTLCTFSSVYDICPSGVLRHLIQHGLSYDVVLGFLWPSSNNWSVLPQNRLKRVLCELRQLAKLNIFRASLLNIIYHSRLFRKSYLPN